MKNNTTLFCALLLALFTLSFKQAKASRPFIGITEVFNPRCNGDTGTAYADVSGGTAPYTYSWAPSGGTDAKGTGMPAGSYTVTVTDNVGQTATAAVTLTQPLLLLANIMPIANNSSCTAPNGSARVSGMGGTLPYTYLWMPGGQTTTIASGLAAYSYTCTVTDAHCCTATASVVVGGTTAPILTLSSTADTNACDGTVSAAVTGGVSPYTYLWSPGGQTTAMVSGLCARTYCCLVTDHSGCKDSTCVAVGTSNHKICCSCNNITTGIATSSPAYSNVVVYPNPNKGIFNLGIRNMEQGISEIQIYNMLGEKIYSSPYTLNNSPFTIDLSSHTNGVYLYRVISDNGNLLGEGKLIIQK